MGSSEPQVGDLFAGKFRIERLLGKGGMGAVYAAMHEGLRQRVAIKVLLGEIAGNPEAVARFMNEASSAAVIQNEHVARVTDVSKTDDGSPYMVMEYLEGRDLSQLLEERKILPQMEAVHYVLQAIEAVHGAHEARVVHRDLKPANLFLAQRPDGSEIIKVLDFGISKVQGDANVSLTSTRSMLGSPLYMSPEQLRSSKTVDSRSDIWSLGIILYELLTGAVPYAGEAIGELFAAILEEEPAPLRHHNPELSVELEAVVMGCLRKKRDERYQSVADLAVALVPFGPADKPSVLALRTARSGMAGTLPLVQGATSSGPVAANRTGMMGPYRPSVPSYAGATGSQSSYLDGGLASAPVGEDPYGAPVRNNYRAFIAIGIAAVVALGIGIAVIVKVREPVLAGDVGSGAPGGTRAGGADTLPTGAMSALTAKELPATAATVSATTTPTVPATVAPTVVTSSQVGSTRPLGVPPGPSVHVRPTAAVVEPIPSAKPSARPTPTVFVPGNRND
jgi:serine/threonine protein kinase